MFVLSLEKNSDKDVYFVRPASFHDSELAGTSLKEGSSRSPPAHPAKPLMPLSVTILEHTDIPLKWARNRIPHLLPPGASHSHTVTRSFPGSSGSCSIKNLPGAVALNVSGCLNMTFEAPFTSWLRNRRAFLLS